MADIKVIGIDPAPGKKGSTVFDGNEVYQKKPYALKKYLKDVKETHDKVLICWDAPINHSLGSVEDPLLYSRPIEDYLKPFFYGKGNRKKENCQGVSVIAYAGCPHWTITRYALGLPKVGEYDSDSLPFYLITENDQRSNIGRSVVEVHPAVAMYLWLGNLQKYKGIAKGKMRASVKDIWCELQKKPIPHLQKVKAFKVEKETVNVPQNDDQLDAIVAYVLGKEWIDSSRSVSLLGNKETGAMLLPYKPELLDQFKLR